MAQALSASQHATALALAEALFPAGSRSPATDSDALLRAVEEQADRQPWLRRALPAALAWLDTRYRLRHFRAFHKAAVAERRAFLDTVAVHPLESPLLRAASISRS